MLPKFAIINQQISALKPRFTQAYTTKFVIIGVGANSSGPWGHPVKTLKRCLDTMNCHNISVLANSSFYESQPVGPAKQSTYVNAVAILSTTLSPQSLLSFCKRMEQSAGRRGFGRPWGPRSLDIDIIDYKGLIINWDLILHRHIPVRHGALNLPHAYAHIRPFVLTPLLELYPKWHHPVFLKSGYDLLQYHNNYYSISPKKGAILRKLGKI